MHRRGAHAPVPDRDKISGVTGAEVSFTNSHCAYADLPKADRRALRDIIKAAFPIGGSAHQLWSEFPDTTAFRRRLSPADADAPAEGVIGAAIVMSHAEDQYDYLAYLAVHPDFRHRRRLFGRGGGPHHGTQLLHYIYDVMRDRVGPSRLQRYLMIEPAGEQALRFYLRALPVSDYPVRFHAEDRVFAVGYDGFSL